MSQFDSSKPIYLQIAEDILQRALRGELKPGDRIPSAREYASQNLVNPNTVVRAYQDLERDGLVFTRRGLGNYLTDDPSRLAAARDELARRCLQRCLRELRELGIRGTELKRLLTELLEVRS
jgi:GntR family transcriptional regulator